MPIKLENVSYVYAPGSSLERLALDNVSLELPSSGIWGLTGAERCGMSSLARVMGGFYRPAQGRLLWNERDVFTRGFDRRDFHRRVAVLLERPERQLFESSLERELGFALRGSELMADERARAVADACELVGLDAEKYGGSLPLKLPLTERRLLAFAAALVRSPELVIFDEPFSALDPRGRKRVAELLLCLRDRGVTVFVLSRNVDFLAEHADRVFILHEGQIIREGTATAVFSDYYDLLHNGAAVPQVRRCVQLLREGGLAMPENVVSYEQFIDRLKILMWRKMK